MRSGWLWMALLLAALGLFGCGGPTARTKPSPVSQRKEKGPTAFILTSAAFLDGQPIARKYTADGDGVSPPLAWSHAPAGTKEFALVVRDPDAPGGTYIHWVLYALPADVTDIPENVPPTETVPPLRDAKQGMNSAGKVGYTPPGPPPGKLHHYIFTLYALDKAIDLPAKASEEQVTGAANGHVLDEAQVVGTYQR